MSTRTAVVVGGNRTPFVKAGGRYASASAQDLLTALRRGDEVQIAGMSVRVERVEDQRILEVLISSNGPLPGAVTRGEG